MNNSTLHKFPFLFLIVLLFAAGVFAQTQFRLGVAYNSSLYSNKERFAFTIGNNETVVLDGTAGVAYFNRRFSAGQSYILLQSSGPRSCNIVPSETQGTFGDRDIVVNVACGTPPLSIFKLEVTGVGSGESFAFADNYNRSRTVPASMTTSLGGYPQGDDYAITQTGGPRPCRMTSAQGTVPTTPITVKANCSTSPSPSPSPAPAPAPTPAPPPTTTTPTMTAPSVDLVSRSTDSKSFGTFYEALSPVIGGKGADEGRYVAFVSYAQGLGGSSGKFRQIIWRDRSTGTTKVVSISPSGEEGNQDSNAPAISADGQSVAFESNASNLVGDDGNLHRDVFVWRSATGKVERVSLTQSGSEADGDSYQATISGDGSVIAFTSGASNIIPNILGQSSTNVYLTETSSRTVQIISKDEKTKKGGGGSNASISDDGSRIAFYSYAPLIESDKNTLWDIYVWERGNPILRRVSNPNGGERNQGDESQSRVVAPTISGNGRFVTFATTATNLAPNKNSGFQEVYLADIDGGDLKRLSAAADDSDSDGDSPVGQGDKIGISHDGNWVVFTTKAKNLGGCVVMRNVSTREIRAIGSSDSTVGTPAISRNGAFVVFGSNQKLDKRFESSGIFVFATAKRP